jgi:hypothetical protein
MPKKSKTPPEPFDAYNSLVRPASEDLKKTLRSSIQAQSGKSVEVTPSDAGRPESLFGIVAVKTMTKGGARSVFSWNEDPLALVIDISVTEELLKADIRFDANFQIIDHGTNSVRKDMWSKGLRPRPARNFSIWQGDKWDMTPERWGLGVGLYLFRGIVEIQQLNFFCSSPNQSLFRVR